MISSLEGRVLKDIFHPSNEKMTEIWMVDIEYMIVLLFFHFPHVLPSNGNGAFPRFWTFRTCRKSSLSFSSRWIESTAILLPSSPPHGIQPSMICIWMFLQLGVSYGASYSQADDWHLSRERRLSVQLFFRIFLHANPKYLKIPRAALKFKKFH